MSDVTVDPVPDLASAVRPPESAGLSLLLKHAEHSLRQGLQPILDEVDLSMDHWRIMSVLLVEPGLRMSTIADAAAVPAATLTRLMDRLVEQGLIVRRIDPADKRRVVAALSSRGETLAVRLRAEEQALESAIAKGLGADRFAALARELTLLPHLIG